MDAIVTERLTQNYGNVSALKEVSFAVRRGELYGIIGADGAGKTTLFRILATLILPKSGRAWVDGYDVKAQYKEIRQRVGYMPGRFSLYLDLSVEENLSFYASVFGTTIRENYALVAPIYKQIEPFARRKAGNLSGGMKQKLALCCALIHKPSVLFLDEPTTGVDPVSRQEFWEMLATLRSYGITILVSTPYMDEANRCDRIALMREGEFMQVDTPQHIIASYSETLWAAASDDMYRLLGDIRNFKGVKRCYTFGVEHHFTADEATVESLRTYLATRGYKELTIRRVSATIEDCYMQLEDKYHG